MGRYLIPWLGYISSPPTPPLLSVFTLYLEKYLFLRDGRYWRLLDRGRYQFSWLIEREEGRGRE